MNSISITDEFSYKSVFNSLSASPDFNELIDLRTKILASESVIVVFKSLYYFMNIVNVKFPTENADKDISLVYMSSLDIYAQNAHYLFKYGQTNELIEFLKIKVGALEHLRSSVNFLENELLKYELNIFINDNF